MIVVEGSLTGSGFVNQLVYAVCGLDIERKGLVYTANLKGVLLRFAVAGNCVVLFFILYISVSGQRGSALHNAHLVKISVCTVGAYGNAVNVKAECGALGTCGAEVNCVVCGFVKRQAGDISAPPGSLFVGAAVYIHFFAVGGIDHHVGST